MKYTCLLILLLHSLPSMSQTYLVKEGKLADTITDTSLEYGSPLPYFYSVGGKYPVSSATLLKEVQAFTGKQNSHYTGSGYITFRFIIDTTGHMLHKVKVMQTDEHYKSYRFDQALVNELFSAVAALDKWRIARFGSGEALPYIVFITFKLKHGKVVNIIP